MSAKRITVVRSNFKTIANTCPMQKYNCKRKAMDRLTIIQTCLGSIWYEATWRTSHSHRVIIGAEPFSNLRFVLQTTGFLPIDLFF